MSALTRWRRDHSRTIALLGAGFAVLSVLLKVDFFLSPGVTGVLRGLAQHGFVLGWLLILTARSRTVSLPTLASFWLLGVWSVFLVAYLIEWPVGELWGVQATDLFLPVYWAPLVEEILKLAPVALFFALAARSGRRQPAMTDGLLLGFMVGAGVSFHEDAHVARIFVSGDGWGAGTPWSAIFPTISPLGPVFALNHAIWAALSGFGIGTAFMFRHWRWTRVMAIVGFLFAVTNHSMLNYFADGTVERALELLGRADAPWQFSSIKELTNGGRIPMAILVLGAVAAAIVEWRILRSIGGRDPMFQPMPTGHLVNLFKTANTREGFTRLIAAERYLRLRRTIYFGGWQKMAIGGRPEVTDTDVARLRSLWRRAGVPAQTKTAVQAPPGPPSPTADSVITPDTSAPSDPPDISP